MKSKISNHEAERLQFMTQGVNSLLSGITFWDLCKSTYDKRFFAIISAFFFSFYPFREKTVLKLVFVSKDLFEVCLLGCAVYRIGRRSAVAGNFFELLGNISALSNEVTVGISGSFTRFGSPDVLIRDMSIAGK